MPSCVKYSVLNHLVTISKQSITMYDACFLIYLMTLPQLCMFMMSNDFGYGFLLFILCVTINQQNAHSNLHIH